VIERGPSSEDVVDALVLAAMPDEMRELRAMLADMRLLPGEGAVWRGRWRGRHVALAVTGDGDRNARVGAAAALRRVRPRAVIAIGVAGALSPELATGQLLVAHRVLRENGDAWQAPPPWLAGAARLAGARPAALISVPRLAATVADKQRLLSLAGARAPGLMAAVDLESAAFAAAAASRGLPWLILRAISDTAAEALPSLLNRCLDEGGAIRRGVLAARLFSQPSALPQLLQLRQRVRACSTGLANAATAVIENAQTELEGGTKAQRVG
jgi:adenosylhomocysteine nucleosidase